MLLASLLSTLALASACAAPLSEAGPSVARPAGDEALEIDATRWFGLEGAPPTLATLRGRAVLLEFWATW